MNPISRDDLARLFQEARISKRLQKELRFVPEGIIDWEDRDFLAICNRSRSGGVLLVPFISLAPIPFRMRPRSAGTSGRTEAIICDFCATWRRGSASASITFEKEKSTVSFLCCDDLDCSLHVRNKTSAATLSRTQLRENISEEERVARLKTRLKNIIKDIRQ